MRASLAGSATDLRTSICAARWKITSGFTRPTRSLTASASRTSTSSSCAPFPSACSRFSRLPVERSSSTVTSSPRASRASTMFEPMKPAPPVTSAFMRRRMLEGAAGACGQSSSILPESSEPLEPLPELSLPEPLLSSPPWSSNVVVGGGATGVGASVVFVRAAASRCARRRAAARRLRARCARSRALLRPGLCSIGGAGRERLSGAQRLGREAHVVARDRVREQADAHRGQEAGDGERCDGCEASEGHRLRG